MHAIVQAPMARLRSLRYVFACIPHFSRQRALADHRFCHLILIHSRRDIFLTAQETQNQLQFQDRQSGQSATCGFKSQKIIKTNLSIACPLP
jgi:hypothetical protein